MIWAQLVLLAVVGLMAVYFLKTRGKARTKAYKKLALIAFLAVSVVTITFPDLLTRIANLLGIGRGADLLLYGLALTVLFMMLNTYLKDRESRQTINTLARRLAILEANQRRQPD